MFELHVGYIVVLLRKTLYGNFPNLDPLIVLLLPALTKWDHENGTKRPSKNLDFQKSH